jgi:asparaginyl-tRNA synthetase
VSDTNWLNPLDTNHQQLSEYTHVEAELDFITFDDLLSHLEHVICRVIDLALENPIAAEAIKKYNPEFKKPERPFLRMRYSDAIDWLRERGIKNEEGNDHTFGDDMYVDIWSSTYRIC